MVVNRPDLGPKSKLQEVVYLAAVLLQYMLLNLFFPSVPTVDNSRTSNMSQIDTLLLTTLSNRCKNRRNNCRTRNRFYFCLVSLFPCSLMCPALPWLPFSILFARNNVK